MRILASAKRSTVALALVAAPWLAVLGPAAPARADDPAPVAPDTKSSAPTDAPPPDGPPPPAAIPAATPAPVPHLSSPQNLPPYTTATSDGSQDSDQMSYLKDVWHAVQDHEVSPSQALVLLAQRPMDADAAPPPGMPAGPPGPVSPGPAPNPGPAPDAPPS